jgi:hypothetical protein
MAGPGRPAYPEWFRGPLLADSLQHLGKVARGEEEDAKISRAQACLEVINRVIGTPKPADGGGVDGLAELIEKALTLSGVLPPKVDDPEDV